MLTTKQELHVHDYQKLGFIREVGTTKPAELLVRGVEPRMVNRIILMRTCECGRSQAFECGDKDVMRKLYTELRG